MKSWFIFSAFMVTLLVTSPAKAWEGHFLMTYSALKNMPEVVNKPPVQAEAMSAFIEKEKTVLPNLLTNNEQWSLQHVPTYPLLPSKLNFTGNPSLQQSFLESIRINPDLHYPLFSQSLPNESIAVNSLPQKEVMIPSLISNPAIRIVNPPLRKVNSGQKLSPLAIISTASDEPDYGLDVGVWEDNPTWFGKIYGWGKQPFGNSNVGYSSQAPFHMGFYYESPLLYAAAPFLKRCYPEHRIHFYLTLSQYAFKTGHDYWGYRFLGWALHYIQDLTQPYHSTVAPGMSTAKLIGINTLDLLGFHALKQNTIQLLTNRHFALENYEYNLLRVAVLDNGQSNPLVHALADQQHDTVYPRYNNFYPRAIVAKESHNRAAVIDQDVREAFPSHYINDSSYIFYTTDPKINLLEVAKVNPALKVDALNKQLVTIMQSVGSHTRNFTRYVLEK